MKKFLLFALVLVVAIFALCACEDKKQENNESENTNVVDTTKTTREKTPEELGKFTVVYNGVDFGPGVYFDRIKDALGQESKPSDSTKACGPNVKGDITNYYYDGVTICVNYMGMITSVAVDSDNATLSCGAKVGMKPEEVKALVGDCQEDDYSINVKLGDDFYVTFIKDEDGTISHISSEDLSIEV